jgi:hypothetical protein
VETQGYNEISASNQRSTGKRAMKKTKKVSSFKMPRVTHMGKRAKVSKGPAKKIGKE